MKVFAVALAALALTPVAAATEEATWQEEIAALKSEVAELKEMLYAGRGLGRRQQPGAGLARDRRRMKQDRRRLAAAHDNDRRSLKNKDGSDELGEDFSMVKYMREAMAANTTIFDTLEDHAGVLEDHTEVLSVVDDTLGEIDSTNTTLFATLSDHADALDDIDATNTTLFATLSGQADLLSTQASLLQDHADALDNIDDTNTTLFATLSEQADLLSTQASLLQDHADALDDIDDTNVTVFGAIDDFEDRIADEEAATAAADCIVYTACGAE